MASTSTVITKDIFSTEKGQVLLLEINKQASIIDKAVKDLIEAEKSVINNIKEIFTDFMHKNNKSGIIKDSKATSPGAIMSLFPINEVLTENYNKAIDNYLDTIRKQQKIITDIYKKSNIIIDENDFAFTDAYINDVESMLRGQMFYNLFLVTVSSYIISAKISKRKVFDVIKDFENRFILSSSPESSGYYIKSIAKDSIYKYVGIVTQRIYNRYIKNIDKEFIAIYYSGTPDRKSICKVFEGILTPYDEFIDELKWINESSKDKDNELTDANFFINRGGTNCSHISYIIDTSAF